MTIAEMLSQSGILTILGMGVVFGFLALMVFCVSTLGKFFQAREAAASKVSPVGSDPASQAAPPENAGQVIAAISAAVYQYHK